MDNMYGQVQMVHSLTILEDKIGAQLQKKTQIWESVNDWRPIRNKRIPELVEKK